MIAGVLAFGGKYIYQQFITRSVQPKYLHHGQGSVSEGVK